MLSHLKSIGLTQPETVHRNLNSTELVEHAIRRGEGVLSEHGALITRTGKYTGRSPLDKFTVLDDTTKDTIWWGDEHRSVDPETFNKLHARIAAYLQDKPLYVQDCFAGHNREYRMRVRVVTERAWHNLFASNMFIPAEKDELEHFTPQFTIIQAPGFKAIPEIDGTHSEAAIFVDYTKRLVVICGTEYAGEIKKSIFTALNYILPELGVLGMHCSANIGQEGDSAVFFGLSGTGKTTLSADPNRLLIGDDEHGWSQQGIFNFEGGCYAKMIRLDREAEPVIYSMTERFGTILENVVYDENRVLDLDDPQFAENTRASYPLSALPNAVESGQGGHPKNIVLLTCDAFGVMPPIARLTTEQAMFHFLSGYTAKVAGTERGVTEPKAVFSACFGAPFMARHPMVYAELLGHKIDEHDVNCWLVNTGWTGGPFGVGKRMKIQWTRTLLESALDGSLHRSEFVKHPVFNVEVPRSVPGVPSEILDPRSTWSNTAAYDEKAAYLADHFHRNFAKFAERAPEGLADAGPRRYR